jgi:hypothetical protein
MAENIDYFNTVTGRLFAELYKNFPNKIEIDIEKITRNLEKQNYNDSWDMDEFAKTSLVWLADAGYVWLDKPIAYAQKFSAVLSPKGLESLQAIPDSIEPKQSLGEKLIEMSKKGVDETMNQLVKIAISHGITCL